VVVTGLFWCTLYWDNTKHSCSLKCATLFRMQHNKYSLREGALVTNNSKQKEKQSPRSVIEVKESWQLAKCAYTNSPLS